MEESILKRSYVIYPNGESAQTKTWLFFRRYPRVMPGSKVVVPIKDTTRQNSKLSATEVASITAAFTSIVGIIVTIVNSL
jgi:hypothetical protein